jgi:hypothetical protein
MAGQQAVEKPAMAVGPIHHGGNRQAPALGFGEMHESRLSLAWCGLENKHLRLISARSLMNAVLEPDNDSLSKEKSQWVRQQRGG